MASNPNQNERDIAAIVKILSCLQPDTSTRLEAFAQETAGPGSTPHQIQWHMINVIWNDTQQGRGSFGDRLPYYPSRSLPQIHTVPARITHQVGTDTPTVKRQRISVADTKRNRDTKLKEIEERISRMIKDVEEDLGGDISKAELQKMLAIQLIKRGTQLIEDQ